MSCSDVVADRPLREELVTPLSDLDRLGMALERLLTVYSHLAVFMKRLGNFRPYHLGCLSTRMRTRLIEGNAGVTGAADPSISLPDHSSWG